jgi:hypothetical protein
MTVAGCSCWWRSVRCRLPLALLRGWSSVLSWSRRSGHHPQRCGPGRWLVGGTSAAGHSSPGHLPLLLVVKRQTEGIPKGHQRPLHGIGFGFLEGRFMGLAQVGVDAMAGAAALADQLGTAALADGDANAGGVGDAPARATITADGALTLVDAAEGDGFALPAVKAKDAIGFCDHLPALQIADGAAALPPLAHLGAIQRGREGSDLLGGEGAGHGRDGMGWRRLGVMAGTGRDQLSWSHREVRLAAQRLPC